MDWLAEKFQFDYVLYSLEKGVFKFIQGLNIPSQIQFLSQENTLMPEVQEIAQFFCDTFPIIFIADANPDGRFLLAKLDRDANNILTEITSTCKTEKIIFISANRFDYTFGQSNADLSEYYKLIKRVMLRQDISTVGEDEQEVDDEDGVALPNRKETKVIWVATSPWELKYAEIKLQDDYMKVRE